MRQSSEGVNVGRTVYIKRGGVAHSPRSATAVSPGWHHTTDLGDSRNGADLDLRVRPVLMERLARCAHHSRSAAPW